MVIPTVTYHIGFHLEDSLCHGDGSAVIDYLVHSREVLRMYVRDNGMCGPSCVCLPRDVVQIGGYVWIFHIAKEEAAYFHL